MMRVARIVTPLLKANPVPPFTSQCFNNHNRQLIKYYNLFCKEV